MNGYNTWRIPQMQYLLLSNVKRVLRTSESNFGELRKAEVRRIPLPRTYLGEYYSRSYLVSVVGIAELPSRVALR